MLQILPPSLQAVGSYDTVHENLKPHQVAQNNFIDVPRLQHNVKGRGGEEKSLMFPEASGSRRFGRAKYLGNRNCHRVE